VAGLGPDIVRPTINLFGYLTVSTRDKSINGAAGKPSQELETAIDNLLRVVGRPEFGSIELTFHQGRLVQFEKREKTRLPADHG
jgi:hypothetical protein